MPRIIIPANLKKTIVDFVIDMDNLKSFTFVPLNEQKCAIDVNGIRDSISGLEVYLDELKERGQEDGDRSNFWFRYKDVAIHTTGGGMGFWYCADIADNFDNYKHFDISDLSTYHYDSDHKRVIKAAIDNGEFTPDNKDIWHSCDCDDQLS